MSVVNIIHCAAAQPFLKGFCKKTFSVSLCLNLHVSLFLSLFVGLLAQLQLPQTNVVVIQGQTVVLQALYTGSDLSAATVIWNYLKQPKIVSNFFFFFLVMKKVMHHFGLTVPSMVPIIVVGTVWSDQLKGRK